MNERRGTRVMFYVQHLLGIGHQMRAAAITRAMQRHGLDTVYVSGGFDDAALDLGGATIARLPPARAKDATFSVLLDENDRPVDTAWETRRRAALLNTFETVAPDVLLIEGFPFGRRRFRFEFCRCSTRRADGRRWPSRCAIFWSRKTIRREPAPSSISSATGSMR